MSTGAMHPGRRHDGLRRHAINAAKALLDKAPRKSPPMSARCLSNGAAANIDKSLLKELVITDTINPSGRC
jgi:hypothetical protein